MKKIIFFLCLVIIFLTAGCGNNTSKITNDKTSNIESNITIDNTDSIEPTPATTKPTNSLSNTPINKPVYTTGPEFIITSRFKDGAYVSEKNSEFKKDNTTKIIYFHPYWRDLTPKNITDEAIVTKLNQYRNNFSPANYDDKIYNDNTYIYNIVLFNDGMYMLLAGDGNGVMGKTLDKLNQYVHYEEDFEEYVRKLWFAYPNRYYTGEFSNNKLNYSLYFDSPDEVEVILKSLSISNNNLTAVVETNYNGEKEFGLNIEAEYSDDNRIGYNHKVVKLNGKKTIDISMPINRPEGAYIYIKLSNTVYSLQIPS